MAKGPTWNARALWLWVVAAVMATALVRCDPRLRRALDHQEALAPAASSDTAGGLGGVGDVGDVDRGTRDAGGGGGGGGGSSRDGDSIPFEIVP